MINSLDSFIALVVEKFEEHTSVKVICSKPRINGKFQQAHLESMLDHQSKIKVSKKTKTQDFTNTLTQADLPKELSMLPKEEFFFATLQCNGEIWNLLQNKKGTLTVKHQVNKVQESTQSSSTHNRQKAYLIEEDAPFLKLLHVSGNDGKVLAPMQKKYRQINRFVELVMHGLEKEKGPISVADMGSGKGYLTFALFHHLQASGFEVSMTGYELRPELVSLCNGIAENLSLKGLQFKAENIQDADTGDLDLLMALHACDIATDLAIKKALDAKATYIILSPCCHKQIRKEMTKKDTITRYGIYEERIAEMVTDTIRTLILEYHGYSTNIIEFIGSEHTGKNSMITAKFQGKYKKNALDEVAKLKEQYGIKTHYLEQLCFQQMITN